MHQLCQTYVSVSLAFLKKWISCQTFSAIDAMSKQLLGIKLFEGVFQSENLENLNCVLYLKMKLTESYGRVEAGVVCKWICTPEIGCYT